jgi:molybdopterin molybdotransferase
MQKLISVAEAQALMGPLQAPMATECVVLAEAHLRVLAEPLLAPHDAPPFARSAMDGYAVREVKESNELRVVGEGGALSEDAAVRVVTGGPLPQGTIAVIPQEWATLQVDKLRYERKSAATFVRAQGEDILAGQLLLKAGTRLGAIELAILAEFGLTKMIVVKRPRVAHMVTGEELLGPEQELAPGQIRDSNSSLVAGLIEEAQATRVGWARVGDCFETQRAVLAQPPFQEAEILFISGGASVGPRDYGRKLIEELGFKVVFHGVNLRPGKPLLYARHPQGQEAFVLPGNPVSHWVVWQLFVRPLLRRRYGIGLEDEVVSLSLKEDWHLRGGDHRAVFWPGRTHGSRVEPLPLVSSGSLLRLAGANCLIEATQESWAAGDLVRCWLC